MIGAMAFGSVEAQQPSPENAPDVGATVRPRYGVVGGVNMNVHTADFTALPGVPNCCDGFKSGFGFAPSAGVLYEMPLSTQLLLGVRAGYSSQSALLSRDESTTVEMDGDAVPMTIEHTIDASLGSIGIEPMIGYRLGERFSLMGGFRAAFNMTKEYQQQEKIGDDTPRGTFENGRRIRHESSGEIPGASSMQAALLLGGSYELPLNASGTMLAAPEILFSYGLTPVADGLSWNTHAVRAGIALKYSPLPTVEPPPAPVVVPPPPPPPPEKPVLAATIDAVGVSADGTEEKSAKLRVEEFVSTEVRPLLNYIFFGENSDALPQRYARIDPSATKDFTIMSLYGKGTLPVYSQLLNIIGQRMAASPNARLRLVGTNSGSEDGGLDLSRRRAESVRNYLRDVWGISENRFRIETRNQPEKPSNPAYAEGVEENRRVEIYADAPEVLATVKTSDTLRQATPPTIRFRTTVESEAGVRSWRITARQDDRLLKEVAAEGPPPPSLDWNLSRDQSSVPSAPGVISYSLTLHDAAGQTFESQTGRLPVEQITVRRKRNERIADMDVERFSLIVFDYDKAELTDEHRKLVREIRDRIHPDSHVRVSGFADKTGDAAHNQQLALQRARNVAKALGVPEDRIEVSGENELLYDNDIPEGRFYSRTVTVEIETPVVEGDAG
jgi:outer membrane protein OmpA-like peptidoglycan-associated protein